MIWRHMIWTTSASLIEGLFDQTSPHVRCFSITGFWTSRQAGSTLDKNEFGTRRSSQLQDVNIDWHSEDNLESSEPFVGLSRKIRAHFGIPTYSLTELGLIYRFKGRLEDPPVVKELFMPDSTKHNYYMTRRAPDGYCDHPNDWIHAVKQDFVRSLKTESEIPEEVTRRLKDTFLITEKTQPMIMTDENLMVNLRLPFMSLVHDAVDKYDLKGVQK
jgi:hypothetical protein